MGACAPNKDLQTVNISTAWELVYSSTHSQWTGELLWGVRNLSLNWHHALLSTLLNTSDLGLFTSQGYTRTSCLLDNSPLKRAIFPKQITILIGFGWYKLRQREYKTAHHKFEQKELEDYVSLYIFFSNLSEIKVDLFCIFIYSFFWSLFYFFSNWLKYIRQESYTYTEIWFHFQIMCTDLIKRSFDRCQRDWSHCQCDQSMM